MKEFIINYNNMPLSEFTTIIVKANSVKEAINFIIKKLIVKKCSMIFQIV